MEPTALFQPPPEYRDEYGVLYTHGNPCQSHYTPHTDPMDSNAIRLSALQDQRRLHIRRVFDVMQLMILRRDMDRAARCLHILLKSHEWRPLEMWKWGLLVATLADQPNDMALQYLQRISRTRPALRPFTLPYLVREWIICGHYKKAHEELLSVISSYPHRQNPQLHTYLGLLTLHASSTHMNQSFSSDSTSPFIPLSIPDEVPVQARQTAKMHFENAIKMAPRYLQSRHHIVRQRVLRYTRQMERLKSKAMIHRQRIWKQLRNSGWMFRAEEPELSEPRLTMSESSEESLSHATVQPQSDRPSLPPSDFYGLTSDLGEESILYSDSDSDSEEEPPTPLETLSEGPAPPPHGLDPPSSPSQADSEGEEPAKETGYASSLLVCVPAVTWSVHVAHEYLKMVRCRD